MKSKTGNDNRAHRYIILAELNCCFETCVRLNAFTVEEQTSPCCVRLCSFSYSFLFFILVFFLSLSCSCFFLVLCVSLSAVLCTSFELCAQRSRIGRASLSVFHLAVTIGIRWGLLKTEWIVRKIKKEREREASINIL